MPDSPGKSVMTEITGMTGIPGAGPALYYLRSLVLFEKSVCRAYYTHAPHQQTLASVVPSARYCFLLAADLHTPYRIQETRLCSIY